MAVQSRPSAAQAVQRHARDGVDQGAPLIYPHHRPVNYVAGFVMPKMLKVSVVTRVPKQSCVTDQMKCAVFTVPMKCSTITTIEKTTVKANSVAKVSVRSTSEVF